MACFLPEMIDRKPIETGFYAKKAKRGSCNQLPLFRLVIPKAHTVRDPPMPKASLWGGVPPKGMPCGMGPSGWERTLRRSTGLPGRVLWAFGESFGSVLLLGKLVVSTSACFLFMPAGET